MLARRYRSRDFDEIVGQESIARTLQNAIASDRTAHAYLFCGTRGVGKTSMARILAKALNATPDLAEADAIADAILRGEDLDVIEIDGASNRGVQEARDLIASAGLSPARCPCKIYIIDEVHMLTREAFNALLKIMEEPPSHVKFILCTTEPQKVPATIQSRCQRFDFRSIAATRIAAHLREILAKEQIDASDDVIVQVARLGRGSMRDALSLLDRLLASGETELTGDLLESMLGVPDQHLVVAVVEAMIQSDPAAALVAGDELLNHGAGIEQALEMLAEQLRTLLVTSACGDGSDLLDISPEAREEAARQASHFDAPTLVYMIAICDSAARAAKASAAARALFDAALVRLCLSERFADIGAILRGEAAPAPPPAAAKKPAAKKKEEDLSSRSRPAPEPPAAASVAEVKPAPPAAPIAPAALDGPTLWEAVLEVAGRSPSDRARTESLVFQSFEGGTLRLAVGETGADLARFLASQTENLVDLVRRATGQTVRIELSALPGAMPRPSASDDDLQAARQLPRVREAMELFDAVIVDVQPEEPSVRDNPGHGSAADV
ncbi:MAG: DNA polymerase III subunit gamma/tau [Planctomycetota bacterium]